MMTRIKINQSPLEELSKNHPKNWELKILLADIYRTDKNYNKSINLYSKILEEDLTKNKWSIFYSKRNSIRKNK